MTKTYLMHHGILGQKWGVRRYQNPDGSLTEAGKKKKMREDIKKDRKWEKNTDRIVSNISNKVLWEDTFPHQFESGKKYYDSLTKQLNLRANELGVSPSGKNKIQFGREAVQKSMEQYGNVDGAYEVIDNKR